MKTPFISPIRNSRMNLEKVYFWTSTVKDWKLLLKSDSYKQLIVDCLDELVKRKMIIVYAFVIMPNHIHLVWEAMGKNGNEMPHASFNKKTAHELVKDLKLNDPTLLLHFKVSEKERAYRIWQRDALAILMDSRAKVEQKVNYIHLNPLQERWSLADRPENYKWSSAKFYEEGIDDFGFITHYLEKF
ncbi:transposase [Pedobacter sp. KR3-3]|uniref:Transposase n=1 Tax=Pedobacter albus TaxID=3113905 RepID=A0ABU7IC48_9SPHI|nr:transposase [Pedobacter sp. KR3-3]MEE1946941.1 transposase [Pedobacter sp. KR3-3]